MIWLLVEGELRIEEGEFVGQEYVMNVVLQNEANQQFLFQLNR